MPYKPSEKRFEQAKRNFNYHNNEMVRKMELSKKNPKYESESIEHMIKAKYWSDITGKNNPDNYFPERDQTDKEIWANAVNSFKEIYIKTKFNLLNRKKK